MKLLKLINSLEVFKELSDKGGDIYLVGGCIRDFYLNKESKDIDLIIRLLDNDIVLSTLKKHGRVDCVGESFGVIKFLPTNWKEISGSDDPIDIAYPRKDILKDKTLGHLGIESIIDINLPIHEELARRDITINSMAISLKGDIIDPFNGLQDMQNKLIRCTTKSSFTEDSLRSLRCIQFSSRFMFNIDSETFDLIKESLPDLKYISAERYLIELDKIFYKGNILFGLHLLNVTGVAETLFGSLISINIHEPNNIKTISDFYYTILKSSEKFKTILKGDTKTIKGIKAIELLNKPSLTIQEKRYLFYEAIQISSSILDSGILSKEFMDIQKDFNIGKYPTSLKELRVNGNDLLAKGFVGKEIGQELHKLLLESLI